MQIKLITFRPSTEWYSDELRISKIERRRAERKMRKSKLQVDKRYIENVASQQTDYFKNVNLNITQTKFLSLETTKKTFQTYQ